MNLWYVRENLRFVASASLVVLSSILLYTYYVSYVHGYQVVVATNSIGEFWYEVGFLVLVGCLGLYLAVDTVVNIIQR